jgi:hypothetical protein
MKKLKEAYVGYTTNEGSKFGVKLKVLHSKIKDPSNMNKLNHIHYVANAFSYMISLQVYLSDKFNRHIDRVIISDEQLAQYVGCHVNYSVEVINKLRSIFGLTVTRRKERGGAREIIINERVIEFLKVYSLEDLNNYIEKYDLDSINEYKAIQQLYRYRVWGVKDTQLEDHEQHAKRSFLQSMKNFIHRVITNNRSEQARINLVVQHRELLSELNNSQIDRIISEITDGPLSVYWLTILIKLEQKVTLALRKDKNRQDKDAESNRENTSLTNSESNVKETTAHASAIHKAQRKPESEPTPGDIIEILGSWNNMTRGQDKIPHVKTINENTYNAICKRVKSYGKENILSNIKRVSGLDSVANGTYKMSLHNFLTDKTQTLINRLNLPESIEVDDWFTEYWAEHQGIDIIDRIYTESIPNFDSTTEAIEWWNSKQNA